MSATTTTTKTVNIAEMPSDVTVITAMECEHTTDVVKTPNGNTIFSSSSTSNATATAATSSTTTQTSIEAAGEGSSSSNNNNSNSATPNDENANANGKATTTTTTTTKTTKATKATTTNSTLINNNNNNNTTATTNGQPQPKSNATASLENVEDLKIVGHLRSIEQINEQRRIFLSSTISEQTKQQQSTVDVVNSNANTNVTNTNVTNATNTNTTHHKTAHKSNANQTAAQNKENVANGSSNQNTNQNTNNQNLSDNVSNGSVNVNATPHIASPDNFDLTPTNNNNHNNNIVTLQYATLPLVKTPPPSTPPPKPPMLSRTRSLNRGASVNGSTATTPTATPTPTPTTPNAKPVNSVTNTSATNNSATNNSVTNTSVTNSSVNNTSATNTSVTNTSVTNTSATNTSLTNTTNTPTVSEYDDRTWPFGGQTNAGATTPTSTVTIISSVVPEPRRVETIELRDLQTQKSPTLKVAATSTTTTTTPTADVAAAAAAIVQCDDNDVDDDAVAALRKAVVPMGRRQPQSQPMAVSVPPTAPAQPAADKPIATSHYERLIEELKCPGCASPMKAPVLLCRTGHSSCEQCTRVLMLCPLCREPYTDMRSLTVEALCSKAHFRCSNAAGGCTVRLHLDLLGWHEKQCIFKPMKCFMGRVWGDCQWSGREAYWKDHLMAEHGNKVFSTDAIDLIWNMGVKQKPLTGYYVFEVFDEMFNFYEIFDKERVLFTMTVTSTVKDKKYNFAYEVTMLDRDSDALAFTQKFPVHSEYDNDILQDGTCVSVPLGDLAKFIDEDRLLHYRVRITEVKTPRKMKLAIRHSCPPNGHQADYQQTRIEGVNLKNVPTDVILTRKFGADGPSSSRDSPNLSTGQGSGGGVGGGGASSSEDEIERIRRQYYNRHNSDSESDPELDAFIAKRWGTPQLHFNRKYLRNVPSDISSSEDGISQQKNGDTLGLLADQRKQVPDDRASITSTATNYRKRMTNSLRRSMRSLRVDFKSLTTKKTSPSVDKQQPETA